MRLPISSLLPIFWSLTGVCVGPALCPGWKSIFPLLLRATTSLSLDAKVGVWICRIPLFLQAMSHPQSVKNYVLQTNKIRASSRMFARFFSNQKNVGVKGKQVRWHIQGSYLRQDSAKFKLSRLERRKGFLPVYSRPFRIRRKQSIKMAVYSIRSQAAWRDCCKGRRCCTMHQNREMPRWPIQQGLHPYYGYR